MSVPSNSQPKNVQLSRLLRWKRVLKKFDLVTTVCSAPRDANVELVARALVSNMFGRSGRSSISICPAFAVLLAISTSGDVVDIPGSHAPRQRFAKLGTPRTLVVVRRCGSGFDAAAHGL